jgi:CHAT domain-containing protein
MWNSNPSETLRIEYKKYLDSAIDDEIKSVTYMPDQASLSTIWQLTRDYYLILYRDGDRETVYSLLNNIHRWFKPYPEMRNTVGYAQSLLDLCLLLVRDMHKYEEGAMYVEEYAEVTKCVYGENSAQYAVALNNLCYIPCKTNEEKVTLLKKAISIYEISEYQDPAMLNQMKTMYNATLAALTGVVNTDSINNNSDGILTISDCATLIIAERGADALGALNYYKDILSRDKYIDTLRYSEVISYIITAYIQINELAKAQKEIEDFNTNIGIDNIPPNYSRIFYSSAGIIAMRLKDYPKALRFCHTACKLSEQQNRYDIEYCKILGSLSIIYGMAGESISKHFYLDAKWYIDEAISVFETQIGDLTKHGATGLTLLNNKAYIYEALGDRQGSIETYESIVANFVNKEDVKGAWLLAANNLAVLYIKSEKPKKAVALLESLSSKNKEYKQMFAQNLALAYYCIGDSRIKKAVQNFNSISYDNCLDVFNFFTVAEREDYWTGVARELLVLNNLIADKYPDNTDVAFNNLLFVKNLKLMSGDILKKMVDNSSNTELKSKFNKISILRDAISYRSSEQDSISIWLKQLNEEERSILSLVPDYKKNLLKSIHSWHEIKASLKDDEIAVDFTYIPKMQNWGNSNAYGYYGAFVITNKSQMPELISLCEVDSINKLFIGSIPDAQQISMFYKESASIFKKVWGNLVGYLKGKKTIYFSPTGQLNLLNHDALIMDDGKLFGDCYNLVRLSSTDKVLSLDENCTDNQSYHSAVIYGGIQYDISVADMREAAKEYSHRADDHFLLTMRSEDERGHWNYLPGTKTESQNIYSLLTSNKVSTTLLQEKEANEESFKALSGKSPNIIHLSTHGFFLDTTDKVTKNPFMNTVGNYSEKEDKLICTGVLMAGANNVWCGRNQVTGIEDGILTADEISRLDLSRTKLVVLSACETAKGQIDPIDGVLGLQRGLKKAGVGSILMSLWKVSDAVTSILMTEFYTNLGNDMTKHESLKKAAQKVKEQYPDPYFWASFVLLD